MLDSLRLNSEPLIGRLVETLDNCVDPNGWLRVISGDSHHSGVGMPNRTSKVKFVKGVKGEECVMYDCPNCGESLTSAIDEVAIRVACPECTRHFIVPGLVELEARQAKQNDKRRATPDSFMVSEAYGRQLDKKPDYLSEPDTRVTTTQLVGGLVLYFIFWPMAFGFLSLFFLATFFIGYYRLWVYSFYIAVAACFMHTFTLILNAFKANSGR